MKMIVVFVCSVLISDVALASDLPGNSFANFSKPVRKDFEKNIKQYMKQKHACSTFQVKDTRGVKEEGEILVDAKGRLFSGVISEEWDLLACGKPLTLVLVVSPDGAGGTFVAIAEKPSTNQHTPDVDPGSTS